MKHALTLLAVLLASTASALEYVTLFPGEEHPVDPTNLVELHLRTSGQSIGVAELFRGATSERISYELTGPGGSFPVTGLTKIRNAGGGVITLKIATASEINVVSPGTVLVLPENSTGNFDVIIEASDDLLGWMPFFSQTVNSATAKKFFRTRVVKTPVAP